MYERKIEYDRKTLDFAFYLRMDEDTWELVGYARTFQEAEVTLDNLVFELLSGPSFREVA